MSKFKKLLIYCSTLLLLTGCDDLPVNTEEFLKKLFPNVWDFLATFLAFIVLLLIVFYVAYKPVKELIKKRGDYVEGKMDNAEKMEKEAEEKSALAEQAISKSRKEAIEIVEKAKEDANREREIITKKAKEEADNEVLRAKEEIAQEIEKSKDDIHREIVSVALDASKKVLSREVNNKDNEKLIDDFISDLDKE